MLEFCDGCAAQYKSRNCYGELCSSICNLGYYTIIRNFYETSQDAAVGLSEASGRFRYFERDFYEFANSNVQDTKSKKCQKKRTLSTAKTLTGNQKGTTDLLTEYDRRIK